MTPRLRGWAMTLAAAVVLGLLWFQVFLMTGVLWWAAPSAEVPVERPDPPRFRPPATDWVDVDAYLRTHPVWMP